MTYIGSKAFQNCYSFTSLSIPNSVTSIGSGAFNYCSRLQKIIVAKSVPLVIEQSTFDNVNKTTCELIVPIGSKVAYQVANYWKDFINITELNNGLLVHYNSQGGNTVYDTIAEFNTYITTPNAPSKTGYTFSGWYKEEACNNAWIFVTDLVTTNTTLYAKWTINAYTVSYNPQGGCEVSDTIAFYNTKINIPNTTTKVGYTFVGWYKEAACTNAWNFATDVVTNNITLYAKWSPTTNSSNIVAATNLSLFPNPANDMIKIEGEKLQSVTIYNLSGKAQLQLKLQGEESTTINVSGLKTGCYLVEVKTRKGKVNMLKFVKK